MQQNKNKNYLNYIVYWFLCILFAVGVYFTIFNENWLIQWGEVLIVIAIVWFIIHRIYLIFTKQRDSVFWERIDLENEAINAAWNPQILTIDHIPTQLISAYDRVVESSTRIHEKSALWEVRTRYLRTTLTTKHRRWSSTKTTNNALFIEHIIGNKKQAVDAFVIISPDRRDNIMSQIWAYFAWPLMLLYIFSESLDDISKIFEHMNINPYIAWIFILIISWYIWWYITNKIKGKHAVKLENRSFEQDFDVDSNDPIIARQICNPLLITDLSTWLKNNHMDKYVTIYFDFNTNRIIYKFDFLKHDIDSMNEIYAKECINLTTTLIQKIDFLKYMNLVYAWSVLSHKTDNTTQSLNSTQPWSISE